MVDVSGLRNHRHLKINGYLISIETHAEGWRVCIIASQWPAPMPDAPMGMSPHEVICPTPEKLAAALSVFILFAGSQGGDAA